MRAIHTSDWHLGATLGEVGRQEDHQLFLGWLKETLVAHEVDTLLVSGDVFDQPNPSAEAQRAYYTFLRDLGATPLRQVIITGGNHDSPSRLDAPADLLDHLGIHVVGGLEAEPATWSRCLCPLRDASGRVEAVVAAAPFVHEWRLGFRSLEGTPQARSILLAGHFQAFYSRLADLAEAAHPGVPLLAMGHLACLGTQTQDAPLEIHLVGSLGALPSSIFDARFTYVALGHIHRNFAVAGGRAHYSGSPLPLNPREGATPRMVNLVVLEASAPVSVTRLEVPAFRAVLARSGAPEAIEAFLDGLTWTEPLPAMLDLELIVDGHRTGLEDAVRERVAAMKPRPVLVGLRQTLLRDPLAPELDALPALDTLQPREVFRMLCAAKGENADELMPVFEALLGEDVR